MEKEIEESLAKVDEKEGTIDEISVNNLDNDMIKLRIKRRRKLTSRTQKSVFAMKEP